MIRRQARLRREFLLKTCVGNLLNKKIGKGITMVSEDHLPRAMDSGRVKDFDIDEYKYAGSRTPKVVITTSHNPSATLKMFVKELRLVFPNSQRMNRGQCDVKQLMRICCSNDVTDIIVVHEHRGIPDNLVISHLPNGPTAFFNISGVIMRHDVGSIVNIKEQTPHLVFHNFVTKIGERATQILKHLFPVPKLDTKRVITFANNNDYISFRHHIFQYVNKELELTELGPRFQLRLYEIKMGKLDDVRASETEWVLRPYINSSVKKIVLSNENGWEDDD
ncbi:U3 small nucleolar ribonucleoprotein protein IMP4 isoform X3 [Eurosta solidaginis]|uniref:U3 small nucleolar ribonucleoprotein protein IMP4 isoform X3 n=1 Tax=Eurosta solidaginis TaxID=178769 RepID=UPI0035311221